MVIVKAIVCGLDVLLILALLAAVVSDNTEKKLRIVDMAMAIGIAANIFLIMGTR